MSIINRRGQTAATRESPASNACDAVGDSHRGQTAATIESSISNTSDAICDGVVLHRGGDISGCNIPIFIVIVVIIIIRLIRYFCRFVSLIEIVIQVANLDALVIPSEHRSYAGCYSEQ